MTGGAVPLAMVRKRASDGLGTRAPLLLVHGFGQNRYAWHLPSRSLANHLAAPGFDVFNLDLRGHGRLATSARRGVAASTTTCARTCPRRSRRCRALRRAAGLARRALARRPRGYASAPALAGAVAGIVSIGSPYHFTRGSLSLGALALALSGTGPCAAAECPVASGADRRGDALPSALRREPLLPAPAARLARRLAASRTSSSSTCASRSIALRVAEMVESVRVGRRAALRRARGGLRRALRGDGPAAPRRRPARTTISAPPASVRPAFARSRSRDKTYRVATARAHRSAGRARRAAHDVAAGDELAEKARGLKDKPREGQALLTRGQAR